MMPDHRIGTFVTKHVEAQARRSKPHLVESLVAEEPVTRCGRRLRGGDDVKFEYEFVAHLPVCRRCVP